MRSTAQLLAEASVAENKHKKEREQLKELIQRDLKKLRSLDLDGLPARELVIVQCDGKDVLKIERKSSERVDLAALSQAHPEVAQEFTRASVATYYSSLVVNQ